MKVKWDTSGGTLPTIRLKDRVFWINEAKFFAYGYKYGLFVSDPRLRFEREYPIPMKLDLFKARYRGRKTVERWMRLQGKAVHWTHAFGMRDGDYETEDGTTVIYVRENYWGKHERVTVIGRYDKGRCLDGWYEDVKTAKEAAERYFQKHCILLTDEITLF